jgi:hypothetical protein
MRSMFGIRYIVDAEILRPFRAWVSWLRHSIGLHPIFRYNAPSGLSTHSPERAEYKSEAVSPLANNCAAASPLAIKTEKL